MLALDQNFALLLLFGGISNTGAFSKAPPLRKARKGRSRMCVQQLAAESRSQIHLQIQQPSSRAAARAVLIDKRLSQLLNVPVCFWLKSFNTMIQMIVNWIM